MREKKGAVSESDSWWGASSWGVCAPAQPRRRGNAAVCVMASLWTRMRISVLHDWHGRAAVRGRTQQMSSMPSSSRYTPRVSSTSDASATGGGITGRPSAPSVPTSSPSSCSAYLRAWSHRVSESWVGDATALSPMIRANHVGLMESQLEWHHQPASGGLKAEVLSGWGRGSAYMVG